MAEPWTKEDVYDAEISPLMVQIIAICKAHEIPLLAVFQYELRDDGEPGFVTTSIPQPHEDEHMRQLGRLAAKHLATPIVSFAETTTTQPDGSQLITIRRMS